MGGSSVQTLKGHQAKALSKALREAFSPPVRLDELLAYSLDRSREDFSLDDDYQSRLFHILRSADAEGWVLDLVVAARNARPRNAGLQAVAADLGLGTASGALERLIQER